MAWRSVRVGLASTLLSGMVVLGVVTTPPAVAAAPLSCSLLYSTDLDSGDVYTVNPDTGVRAGPVLAGTGAANRIGIGQGGATAIWTAGDTIFEYTASSGTTSSVTGAVPNPAPNATGGAVNPANGYFFYGGYVASTNRYVVSAYNPANNTSVAAVASITLPAGAPTGNSDLTFDSAGNLFILTSSAMNAALVRVNGTIPTSGTVNLTSATIANSSAPGGFNGAAFGGDGYLYLGTQTTLVKLHPSSGAVLATRPISGAGAPTSTDFGSCATPNTLTLLKNLPGGRYAAADQFGLSLTGGGLSSGNTATTAGTETGLQDDVGEFVGPVVGLVGESYTITETAASGTALGNYVSSYRCIDTSRGSAVVATGNTTTGSFTLPAGGAGGAAVVCTFTNQAVPSLRVVKNVNGRVSAPDQFRVTATGTGANGITATTSGTQTTASSPVDQVQTATTYTITDSMVAGSTNPLSDYVPTIACVDTVTGNTKTATPGAAGVWTVAALDYGQKIVCTVTNTGRPASVNIAKTAGTATGPDAGGGYTATYRVTASNTGVSAGSYGPLVDTPSFPANLTVDGISWVSSGAGAAPSGSANGAGPFTIAPGSTTIARNATHTYDVTLRFHFNTRTAVSACNGTANNGLFNRVSLPDGQESGAAGDNAACVAPPSPPNASLLLDKTSSAPADLDGNGVDAGDRITYSFAVTNTGNVRAASLAVADPLLTNVTCNATTLAPGASTTCTGTYLLTQADVDDGTRSNTARATANDPQGNPVTSNPDSTTQTWTADAALQLQKSASNPVDVDGNGRIDAGDRITYTFRVTNTGDVTMRNIAVTDPLVSGIACTPATLAPGEQVVCTAAPYTITQGDMNAGAVNNTAAAGGTRPGGGAVPSNSSSTSTPLTRAPALTIDKVAGAPVDVNGSGLTDAGDRIPYSFTVRNTGNVAVSGIAITDARLAGATIACTPTTLTPNQVATCTAAPAYTVTEADEAEGRVLNSATASGTPAGGGTVTSPPDTATTPVQTPTPRLTIDKVAEAPVDVNGSGIIDAGDRITYSFTVRNTGNVPVTAVAVTDAKLTGSGLTIGCGAGVLAPGDTRACTVSGPYVVTLADEQAGEVVNSATGSARDPDNGPVTSPPDTTTTDVETPAPALTVVKSAGEPVDVNDSGLTDPGDEITYTFRVTNDGNVPLTAVGVADPKLAGQSVTVTCAPAALAPGESVTCTPSGPYTVTAGDETAGQVANTATASGTPPRGPAVTDTDSVNVPVTASEPALAVDKTAGTPVDVNGSGITDVGDEIDYTFVVTNTGNVPIRTVAIDDPKLGAIAITCVPGGPLAPGGTKTCTTDTPYVVTPGDVAAGRVQNTATATGIDPDDDAVESGPDTATVLTTLPDPRLVLEKSAGAPVDVNGSGITDAGDTIAYGFTVRNAGNVPITTLGIADPKLAAQGITIACAPATLVPGATATCTPSGVYRVTTADEAAGAAANSATAEGSDPDGDAAISAPDETATPVATPVAQLDLLKTAGTPVDVNGSGITDAGDTVAFAFAVRNTGNVPITALTITDPMLADAGITVSCSPTTLAPDALATCIPSAPYVVTAGDEAAGAVANTARARAVDPDGDALQSAPSSTSTPTTTPAPALSVDKTAGTPVDTNGSGITDAGDTIGYTFSVRNEGNVPVSAIVIDDPMLAGRGLTCTPATLAPGASAACATTTPYVVTDDDESAGAVTNSARATGTDPDGEPVRSAPDVTSTSTTAPAPALSVEKEAATPVDVNGSGITDAGDTIAFTFTVDNAGNVPLDDVAVVDPMLTGAGLTVTCIPTTLAPGAAAECEPSGPYVVTAADEAAGEVANRATSRATDPDGGLVESAPDRTSTTVTTPRPGLTLVKDAGTADDVNESGVTDAGDTIDYTFTVTNAGNVPVSAVTVDDPMLAAVGISITCTPATVAPAQTSGCTTSAPYVVTEADEVAGQVTNVATAGGTDPDGDPTAPSPEASTTTTTTTPMPGLRVEKTGGTPEDVNDSGITDAGDTMLFSFEVTNTGNVPVREIAIDDPLLAGQGIDIACAPATLAPGAPPAECTHTGDPYVITADDEAQGRVANSATATGADPDDDGVVSGPDTTSTPVTTPAPSLLLTKLAGTPVDANNSGLTDAGDTIAYTFSARNDGNVPISAVGVVDPKLAAGGVTIDCGTGPLAPGATRACTTEGLYTVTTSDVGAGAVVNVATATGIDPDGDGVASPETSTSTPTTQPQPGLQVDKTVGEVVDTNNSGITDSGDQITYTFVVTNTGNVPVGTVAVNDPRLGGDVSCASATLAPGATTTCGPATYVVTEADEAAGSVTNSATSTGTDPDGQPVGSNPDTTSTPVTQPQATLTVQKDAGDPVDLDGNGVDAGDTIDYSFVVRNTGNVPLTVLRVSDPMFPGPNGDGITPCEPALDLDPGDASPCVVLTHTITQPEIDAGVLVNTASGQGTDPDGGTATSPPDTASLLLRQQPALQLDKVADEPVDTNESGITDAGDTIRFTFVVTNIGNATMNGIAIDDPLVENIAGIAITCPPGPLAPTEVRTCTMGLSDDRVYTVRSADVDAGAVSNTATATGTGPAGLVTSSPSNTATPTTRPQPGLDVEKGVAAIADANDSVIVDAGDEITYVFTVTNTGNVPIDDIVIDDPLLAARGIAVTCSPTTIAPGGPAVVCSHSDPYVVTGADEQAGSVENSATAAGVDPDDGGVVSPADDTSTAVTLPQPRLAITKTAGVPVDVNGSGIVDAGDQVSYTFTVTNEGNVPVAQVAVVDPMLAAAGVPVDCTPTTLAPEQTASCASRTAYTVTSDDVAAGSVANSATATALDPDLDPTPPSNPASTSTPTTRPQPGLSIVKFDAVTDVNDSGLTDAGDTIAYTFTVTNTGNVPLTGIGVDDPLLSDRGIVVDCDDDTLAPGADTSCTADNSFVVTEADETAGSVDNSATATGTDPDQGAVESAPDTTSTPTTAPQPALRLEKVAGLPVDVNGSGLVDAGDTIEFTFTVFNDGNVPLESIAVVDPTGGCGHVFDDHPRAEGGHHVRGRRAVRRHRGRRDCRQRLQPGARHGQRSRRPDRDQPGGHHLHRHLGPAARARHREDRRRARRRQRLRHRRRRRHDRVHVRGHQHRQRAHRHGRGRRPPGRRRHLRGRRARARSRDRLRGRSVRDHRGRRGRRRGRQPGRGHRARPRRRRGREPGRPHVHTDHRPAAAADRREAGCPAGRHQRLRHHRRRRHDPLHFRRHQHRQRAAAPAEHRRPEARRDRRHLSSRSVGPR